MPADASKVNVVFHITEGQQIFVRKVLLTGLHYTRPETVAKAITLHPGDPLNETALIETQRNLYEFALFNEVDTAVENPTGGETYKTVLLQATEARRWALTYGFGFEAQTGTPQYNCGGVDRQRRQLQSQRQNRHQPARAGRPDPQQSLRTGAIGLAAGHLRPAGAEDRPALPESALRGQPELRTHFSGGYANSLDVTTYVASKLEGGSALDRALQRARIAALKGQYLRLRVELPPRQGGSQQPSGLARTKSRCCRRRCAWRARR